MAPERCGDLLLNIAKAGKSCGFLEGDSGENCSEKDLDLLEERLYEYENSLITDGLHEINEAELNGLVHGLDGGYVPVGTAGDVVKNPSILPSGRNLVQFDPRLVPTRTACERGMKAAQLSVEAYHEKTGTYPDTTALILWGLETSRSQGETIGQILYYLGIRLKTEKSSYDDRLEVIPTEELDRPRMDVVIHICGFFRDMYPNLIDNLNAMFRQILRLEEGPEKELFYGKYQKDGRRAPEIPSRNGGTGSLGSGILQDLWPQRRGVWNPAYGCCAKRQLEGCGRDRKFFYRGSLLRVFLPEARSESRRSAGRAV